MHRRLSRLLALAAVLACADSTGPDGPTPAALRVVDGDAQVAPVDALLPRDVLLQVTDAAGTPLEGAEVTARVAGGGGSVTPGRGRTDARGELRLEWRLGGASREQALELRAGRAPAARVTATAHGSIAELRVDAPADSVEAGQWVTLVPHVLDSFGAERTDVRVEWTNQTPDLLEVDATGRVRALGRGTGDIHARAGGRETFVVVRAYDVPTSLGVQVLQPGLAFDAPVDIEGRATLRPFVRGRMGRPMPALAPGAVTFSCDAPTLWVRCDSVLVPRVQALPQPATVQVTVRDATLQGTTAVRVHEAPVGTMWVRWPPAAAVIERIESFADTAEVLLGDTLQLHLTALGTAPVFDGTYWTLPLLLNRPFRFALEDPALAQVTPGDTVQHQRVAHVVGTRAGVTRMRVLVNGATVGFTLRVRARATSACTEVTALDLAVGELRMLRGGDAARCLRFERARDAGRAYLLLTDATPLETTSAPWETPGAAGEALFASATAPKARANPVLRIHTPDAPPAALLAWPLAMRQPRAGRWRIRGEELGERAPALARAPSLVAATTTTPPAVAVGDTLDLGESPSLHPDLRTTDGGALDRRIVVTHVGPRLVSAELLDVQRGRLVFVDGRKPSAVPAGMAAQVDLEYAVPARQLARLFPGTPAQHQAFGRDFGARELWVNGPLASGIAGYAEANYVVADYRRAGSGADAPRLFADWLLAHEFAHVRHVWNHAPGSRQPDHWQVEGVAHFVERMVMTARATGLDAPPRTARWTEIGDRFRAPVPFIHYSSSLFQGYEQSAYLFDYLADHVEAGGGDGLAAVRGLASAQSAAAADAVIGAGLPGMGVHELVLRARVAAVLEQLRYPQCTTCLAPDPALPAWTRFLQYDVPALPRTRQELQASLWPVLRPGTPDGVVVQQRTGSMWPTLIDGRDATGDGTWVLDFTDAPQTTVSVVRIR